jgi:hypothetical protein
VNLQRVGPVRPGESKTIASWWIIATLRQFDLPHFRNMILSLSADVACGLGGAGGGGGGGGVGWRWLGGGMSTDAAVSSVSTEQLCLGSTGSVLGPGPMRVVWGGMELGAGGGGGVRGIEGGVRWRGVEIVGRSAVGAIELDNSVGEPLLQHIAS